MGWSRKARPGWIRAAGAHIAVGRQAGIPQIDVFVVGNTGQLNVFWAYENVPWAGPVGIGPSGLAPAGAALSTSQQFGIPQTDVFVYDNDGQLNVFYVVDGGPWGGPVKIGETRFSPPGAKTAVSEQFGVVEPPAAAPSGGLGSYSNYFLADNCIPLTGVKVLIVINEDLVAAPPTGTNQPGFAFQFNASSPIDSANPQNPKWIVWQQYIIGVSTSIGCAINNWTVASLKSGNQTINSPAPALAQLAQPSVLPAGTTVSLLLSFDNHQNVTAATFALTPGDSKPITLTLTDLTLSSAEGGGPVTTADLAPIVAFELNLVGPGDAKHAHFLSGAGTIIYTASNFLTPLPALPSCVANNSTTGETSNSTYGTLPVGPSNSFTQSFSVNASAP